METAQVKYLGNLRTESTHLQSGQVIITDAPKDNEGNGEAFSPTDLVCSALASCMLTIMGILAKRENIELKGTIIHVTKTMESNPRRIGAIQIDIVFAQNYNPADKIRLENAAKTCPVAKSLSPEIQQNITFIYPN